MYTYCMQYRRAAFTLKLEEMVGVEKHTLDRILFGSL